VDQQDPETGLPSESGLPNALTPRDPFDSNGQCPDAVGNFAGALPFDGSIAVVDGNIEAFNQVDIYEIGDLDVATRFRIEADEISGGLDPQVGIFDQDGQLVGLNDDEALEQNVLDSLLTGLIRRPSRYFVAVEASRFFPGSCPTTGEYRLTVQLAAEDPSAAAPLDQRVFLDFDGAEIRNFPRLGNVTLSAMSAADAGLSADDTISLKSRIVEIVLSDYSQFSVSFSTSDEGPPESPFTTVVIGSGDDVPFFGIADEVDDFNSDLSNTVLVFTNVFQGVTRNFEEMAVAIANVISHELGHGLGLYHVEGDSLLMDVTSNSLLVRDQRFGQGVLSDFLVGAQDAVLILSELLGLL
jgi:hypothetical protein